MQLIKTIFTVSFFFSFQLNIQAAQAAPKKSFHTKVWTIKNLIGLNLVEFYTNGAIRLNGRQEGYSTCLETDESRKERKRKESKEHDFQGTIDDIINSKQTDNGVKKVDLSNLLGYQIYKPLSDISLSNIEGYYTEEHPFGKYNDDIKKQVISFYCTLPVSDFAHLRGLTNLTKIICKLNRTELPPGLLRDTPALKTLILTGSPLTELQEDSLHSETLEKLSLSLVDNPNINENALNVPSLQQIEISLFSSFVNFNLSQFILHLEEIQKHTGIEHIFINARPITKKPYSALSCEELISRKDEILAHAQNGQHPELYDGFHYFLYPKEGNEGVQENFAQNVTRLLMPQMPEETTLIIKS